MPILAWLSTVSLWAPAGMMLLILPTPQLEDPGEEHTPEGRISYKHFWELPPPSEGKEHKQRGTLTASAGSRVGCSQSGKQNPCQCTLTGGERVPTVGWWARDHCQAERTGANVKISWSAQKKPSLLHSPVLCFLCIPNIFRGDNSPYVCCLLVHLFSLKATCWDRVLLLTIFSSFIHTWLLTFVYDCTPLGSHFWCTCETSSKVIGTKDL